MSEAAFGLRWVTSLAENVPLRQAAAASFAAIGSTCRCVYRISIACVVAGHLHYHRQGQALFEKPADAVVPEVVEVQVFDRGLGDDLVPLPLEEAIATGAGEDRKHVPPNKTAG